MMESNIPPLAIIQARYNSKRLPGKVLMPLGGKSLLQRVWETTVTAFGAGNTIVATCANEWNQPIIEACTRMGAECFAWEGEENDVLGRFYVCAHRYRWHPESIIVRVTPDDAFKEASLMKQVAFNGIRLPVEQSCEAFTLKQLDAAHARTPRVTGYTVVGAPLADGQNREHITYALFPTLPPKAPPRDLPYSIDTEADLIAVRRVTDAYTSPSSPFDGGPWSPC